MRTLKVFYAQPVDEVPPEIVLSKVEALRRLVSAEIEIVAPYLEDDRLRGPVDQAAARTLVERDRAAIEASDVVVIDLSRDDRPAVGIIFEMAYACSLGKPAIVYQGESSVQQRVWLVALADTFCRSWEEVRRSLLLIASQRGDRPAAGHKDD